MSEYNETCQLRNLEMCLVGEQEKEIMKCGFFYIWFESLSRQQMLQRVWKFEC